MKSDTQGLKIQIVEVGLRDGLQNEKVLVSTSDRVELARRLYQAGTRRMELGAFVRADRVPQMAGSAEVVKQVLAKSEMNERSQFSVLVPNPRGFDEVKGTGLQEIAIFGSSSEAFSKANINCTIEESFKRFQEVMALARAEGLQVRGYLSTCFGCPFEGKVDPARVLDLVLRMIDIGCYEVSIGDTIGVANPRQVESLFTKLLKTLKPSQLAGHFHDTRGTALANILRAYLLGIRTFDSSLGGLGGCPYAPSATGNVATEDVVYMFESMGIRTGLDLPSLIETNHWMSRVMGKELNSLVSKAGLPKGYPLS